MTDASRATDVVVIGGGIAGLSAAITLRRRGLRVRCIEPDPPPRTRVGESLDWSAPALLDDIGLPRDEIVGSHRGTYKRQVHAYTADGRHLVAGPPRWLASWPFDFETVTLHVDRERLDLALFEAAIEAGVDFEIDHVTDVHLEGDRVIRCTTMSGATHGADWFIDASGRRRIIARAADVGARTWGCERIALWSYRPSGSPVDGTVLHLNDVGDDLSWAWEIPIDEHRTSVGVVVSRSTFRELRGPHEPMAETFASALRRFPELEPLDGPPTPLARAYQPYVSDRVVGINWLLVGEAAALVDPLSSLGVTAALRHGGEAAAILADGLGRSYGVDDRLTSFDRRVRRIASVYNDGLSELLYRPGLRRRVGIKQAARAYIIPGYLTNAAYTRLRPATSRYGDAAVAAIVLLVRTWTKAWLLLTPDRSGRTFNHHLRVGG